MTTPRDQDGVSLWWHLCDELTVVQASLLLLGVDPEKKDIARPSGYEPVETAICRALEADIIKGQKVYESSYDRRWLNIHDSTVEVASLKEWLSSKGINTGFFFASESSALPGYLTPSHPRYVPRLAAAIKVWQAMEDANLYAGKSPKKAMENWLESNYKELGLVHKKSNKKNGYKEGGINRTAIEEAAKVANWQEDGGAPKTPESKTSPTASQNLPTPSPPIENNDLGEIPF